MSKTHFEDVINVQKQCNTKKSLSLNDVEQRNRSGEETSARLEQDVYTAVFDAVAPIIIVLTPELCLCEPPQFLVRLTSYPLVNCSQTLLRSLLQKAESESSCPSTKRSLYEALSPRLREVLKLKANGMGNEQIAEAMTVDLDTVKKYLVRIRKRLDVATTQDAIGLWNLSFG